MGCGAVRLLDAETGELKRMYVAPAARGTGLGRRLVKALEAEARALGARRLVLETGTRQHAAIALYRATGFVPIPLYGEYLGSPATSVCLGKELAGQEALAHGVTSFHDAGSSFATIDRLRALADSGLLPVRLYVMVRGESNARLDSLLPRYRLQNHADGFLTVRSIKKSIDGALGPHGAWLLEPYADLPSSTGQNTETPENIAETARVAIRHGFQVNTHAIGDRGNRLVLDAFEAALKGGGAPASARPAPAPSPAPATTPQG